MNIELLIKLCRLANNNPNENEANSAARRACKLIEEGEYKFSDEPVINNKRESWSGFSNPPRQNSWDFYEEYVRQAQRAQQAREEEEVKKQNEEHAKRARRAWDYIYVDKDEFPFAQKSKSRYETKYKHTVICNRCNLESKAEKPYDHWTCRMCRDKAKRSEK